MADTNTTCMKQQKKIIDPNTGKRPYKKRNQENEPPVTSPKPKGTTPPPPPPLTAATYNPSKYEVKYDLPIPGGKEDFTRYYPFNEMKTGGYIEIAIDDPNSNLDRIKKAFAQYKKQPQSEIKEGEPSAGQTKKFRADQYFDPNDPDKILGTRIFRVL